MPAIFGNLHQSTLSAAGKQFHFIILELQDLKDKLKQRLIDHDGNVLPHQLTDIVEEAKELGLTDRDVARLMPEIDQSINWAQVRKEKDAAEALLAEARMQEADHQKEINEAPVFLDTIIDLAFENGVLSEADLATIFLRAETLKQNTYALASEIKKRLDARSYRPYPAPKLDATSLQAILMSTSWYSAGKFPQQEGISLKKQAPKQEEPTAPPPPAIPKINYFRSDPKTVVRGGSAILTWSVAGVSEVTISGLGTTKSLAGRATVNPVKSTSYHLQAGDLAETLTVSVARRNYKNAILIWLLLVAAIGAAGYYLLHQQPAHDYAAVSARGADKAKIERVPEPNRTTKPTLIMSLRGGNKQSGLQKEEAKGLYKAVHAYIDEINRIPLRPDEVLNFFLFPMENYYGSKKASATTISEGLISYHEKLQYWNTKLMPDSKFQGIVNGLYEVHLTEWYKYRSNQPGARDTIVTLEAQDKLMLDRNFKIVSIGKNGNRKVLFRQYRPEE